MTNDPWLVIWVIWVISGHLPTLVYTTTSSSNRSYASVVKSVAFTTVLKPPSPKISHGVESDSTDLTLVLGKIADDLTQMKNQIVSLRDAVHVMERKHNDASTIQSVVNRMNDALLANNAPAADSYVREQFPLLLSGFELLQKELYRLGMEVAVLKSTADPAVRDEDHRNESDGSLTS